MSLFSALYTGASGMTAQSQATANVSDNIANLTTTGFKKTDTAFYDLVTTTRYTPGYTPGVVYATNVQRIDQQGSVQQTGSKTDASISGNGFFVVKQDATDPAAPLFYTRNGSFVPDVNGILRNANGFALYAIPLDSTGAVPAGAISAAGLVPADVDILDNAFVPTSQMSLSFNLDANQKATDPQVSGAGALPVPGQAAGSDFSRSIAVVDESGNQQLLTFNFTKVTGPMAQTTSQTGGLTSSTSLTDPNVFSSINAGDKFTVTDIGGATTQNYIIGAPAGPGQVRIDTVGDLMTQLNTVFGGGGVVNASLDGSGRLLIRSADPTSTLTLTNNTGTPLSGLGTLDLVSLNNTPQASLTANSAAYPDQTDFPAFGNTATPDMYNWWQMTVVKPDGTTQAQGLINFNGDGTLNTPRDANGNVISAKVALTGIDWGNGSPLQDISVDTSQFFQHAGQYDVALQQQDGIQSGTRTGVAITNSGMISATFSNGITRNLYQIPLMTFVAPDALQQADGTVFSETQESGPGTLDLPGSGGAGTVSGATLEGSNVDLGEEFSKMIVGQRAFGADSQVIQATNEMLTRLAQLKQGG